MLKILRNLKNSKRVLLAIAEKVLAEQESKFESHSEYFD